MRIEYQIALLFLAILGALLFYLLPSAIAYSRSHKNFRAIFLLNLFLGVSGLGWIIALVWSLKNPREREREEREERDIVRERLTGLFQENTNE